MYTYYCDIIPYYASIFAWVKFYAADFSHIIIPLSISITQGQLNFLSSKHFWLWYHILVHVSYLSFDTHTMCMLPLLHVDATRPSHISWKGKKPLIVIATNMSFYSLVWYGMVWYAVLCRLFPTQNSLSRDTQMPSLNFWWVSRHVCVWLRDGKMKLDKFF